MALTSHDKDLAEFIQQLQHSFKLKLLSEFFFLTHKTFYHIINCSIVQMFNYGGPMSEISMENMQINNARKAIANIEKCEKMSDIFKVLGDSGRLKVVKALSAGELCASDIALVLNIQNSVASHQLKLLKQSGIIAARKEGKFIYYRIENECVKKLFELMDEHLNNCK